MPGLGACLLALLVPLCAALRTGFDDQPQVIGSPEAVVAVVGDDVILPCHVEPKFNVQGLTVEWSKPDLKPDPLDRLSRVEYVHLYRDRQEVPDMKIWSYIRRTELFTDQLRDGNISLKIRNVTLADEGRYRCFIPKLKSRVKASIIRLVVKPKSVHTTDTPLRARTPDPNETDAEAGSANQSLWISAVVVVVVVVLISAVGIIGYFLKHKHQNHLRYDTCHQFRI
ncbi:myelin-oligodendrocyte glycoprotein-like [Plectropomus leopardus]|uniref:myelin-oligodendrocyte glycoprotein-like n=1 Tax=Plectropomus leopardus TaxID=160734 RepID=UPI001C4C9DFC|nr:myelin-oligodendrocyte glycoprotein-like [Plectropomus leopardus]